MLHHYVINNTHHHRACIGASSQQQQEPEEPAVPTPVPVTLTSTVKLLPGQSIASTTHFIKLELSGNLIVAAGDADSEDYEQVRHTVY
jgi:hypothetical protein